MLGIPSGTGRTLAATVRSSKGSEFGDDRRSQVGQWCMAEFWGFFLNCFLGIPWWSSGEDSVLLLQGHGFNPW